MSSRERASSVRLGVVSFAHGHVNAYVAIGPAARSDLPDARVVAAWDDDRVRGTAQCQKYGLAFEEDLGALLRRDDVDAVCVTSPTNQHAAHAVAAAQAGKHVLLQKPMARSLQD
jgi:predicted dehydrogenase